MWSKTYSAKVTGLTAEKAWSVWSDVDHWHTWQADTDYARLTGPFAVGSRFLLKPKGGPKVKIELVEVKPNVGFTDMTRFPLARMYGIHEFIAHEDGLELRTTMRIEGPLSFVWRKLVGEGIVAGLETQTRELVERARRA